MKIVSWNCRGLGNHPAVHGLLELQKSKKADVLFLSETKMDRRKIEKFRWMLWLTNMVVQEAVGKGGEWLCFGGEESMCHFVISRNTTLTWK
jgi:exonuclease III